MGEIYLCRHGETEWTLTGQHTGKTDLPLTERGKTQSLLLKERLKRESFIKIFTSPKKRALQTSAGLNPLMEPLAVEWDYGDYEGLTSAQILAQHPSWDLFQEGAPRGETPQQVGARADQLLAKFASFQGKIALFSHGHFLRVLAVRYLGLPLLEARHFSLSVASLSILSQERGVQTLALWNDTHHLFSNN